LPQLLHRFSEAWPRVEISLTEGEDDVLLAALEAGELDLAFLVLPISTAPIETTELLRDPYVLVTQAGSPLSRRRTPPSFRDIARLPLVGYRSCIGARQVEARMRAAGVEPSFAFRSDDNATIQEMVAAGMGVAVIPRLTVNESDSRIAILDLEGRMPPRLIGLAWHRDRYRPPATEAFVDAARELCRELEVAA
jgi:DNA-binding transcriptional LysR family regulator